MNKTDKIYISGHNGMVGSAILRNLQQQGFTNIITRNSSELDLRNQAATLDFFQSEEPKFVFLCAAKVGGIQANNLYRAEFLYDNLMIECNVIHSSYISGVKKLLFLGSSCIYPKMALQPIQENALLTGALEPTNEPYAIAKIAGLKLCESYRRQYGCNFISAMPTNLYGPNDNYDLSNSHVLPALLRKFHEAKQNNEEEVILWGTGKPMREFLHVDDLAAACFFLMEKYNSEETTNVGTGKDISILDLAHTIKEVVGYDGKIRHDLTKPDGTPRKLLNIDKLTSLGWKASIELEDGIHSTYEDFKRLNL